MHKIFATSLAVLAWIGLTFGLMCVSVVVLSLFGLVRYSSGHMLVALVIFGLVSALVIRRVRRRLQTSRREVASVIKPPAQPN